MPISSRLPGPSRRAKRLSSARAWGGVEVAQGAAGVEAQPRPALQQGMGRQLVQVGVVAADAQHRHGGMAILQRAAGGAQLVEADVEGHVGRRLQGLQ